MVLVLLTGAHSNCVFPSASMLFLLIVAQARKCLREVV